MMVQFFTHDRNLSSDYCPETGSISVRLDGDSISFLSIDRDGFDSLVDALRGVIQQIEENPPNDDAF